MNGLATMVPSTGSFVQPTSYSAKAYESRRKFNIIHNQLMLFSRRVPNAVQSKACVYCRSLEGVGVSNTAGGMDVCHECYVLSGSLRWADHSSRIVLPSVVCRLSVIVKSNNGRSLLRIQSKSLRQQYPVLNPLSVLLSYFVVT
jgi:hypothetical protein